MTAGISLLVGDQAFQASDRTVSLAYGRRVEPVFEFNIKTVVFTGPNHVVSLSFAGIAFAGRTATDELIVEALVGRRMNPELVLREGVGNVHPSLSHAAEAIRSHLQRRLGPLLTSKTLEVDLVGFQRNRHGWRPMLWTLRKRSGDLTWSEEVDRSRPAHGSYDFQCQGYAATPQSRERLASALGQDPDDPGAVLEDEIRQLASESPTVGASPVLIHIAPTSLLRTGGRSDDAYEEVGYTLRAPEHMPFMVTPWVVGSRTVRPPSLLKVGSGSVSEFLRRHGAFGSDPDPVETERALALFDEAVVLNLPFRRWRPASG